MWNDQCVYVIAVHVCSLYVCILLSLWDLKQLKAFSCWTHLFDSWGFFKHRLTSADAKLLFYFQPEPSYKKGASRELELHFIFTHKPDQTIFLTSWAVFTTLHFLHNLLMLYHSSLERLAMDKYFRLLGSFINYEPKFGSVKNFHA